MSDAATLLARRLSLPGVMSTTGWQLPANLEQTDWREIGRRLHVLERSVMWWLGDWWRAYKPEWGDRAALFDSDWQGPPYPTCRAAETVCNAFDTDRRRSSLTFHHHREVAALPPDIADNLLDEAEANGWATRELRTAAHRISTTRGAQPSSDTLEIADLSDLAATGQQFGCIYADPPWRYDNQTTRAATGNHYLGLTVDELCALPIRELALPDAHLHLWTTNAFLFDAPRIFDAWGFAFRSSFVWVKSSIGIGNYWRNSHEFLLTAIRGTATHFHDHALRSWLECDRGAHSAKPEQVRGMLERASPAPFLELFGRLPTKGWTVWGNQIERNLFSPREAAD